MSIHLKTVALFFNPDADFQAYLPFLDIISPERTQKILHCNCESKKITSILTELLIRHQVSQALSVHPNSIQFLYSSFGKPAVSGYPDFHFSVSHSRNCIAYSQAAVPVGIDCEFMRNAKLNTAKRFFTDDEYRFIISSQNPNAAFFQIWTAKEAYLKMLGCGLRKKLNSFSVIDAPFSHLIINNHIFCRSLSEHSSSPFEVDIVSEALILSDLDLHTH